MTVNPNVLRSEPFAEVGALIQRDAHAILERWGHRAGVEQPHAARAHHQTLLDHLGELLHELGNSLTESGNGTVAHHCRPAFWHGEQRWQAGWSLPEVVRDYQILRLVLVDYLEAALNRPLHSREHQAIGLALDEAIAASVLAHAQHTAAEARAAEQERAERDRQALATLRHHTEQLQEAHRHKDEFLAIMSHELRNPLAPLRNALHILSLNSSPETVAWARELMDRQIHALTRLVDDLLDLSRIGRGKIVLHPERLDLARLVRETVEDRRGSFAEAGLELLVETPTDPVWVNGEGRRLVQVVGNLLHNAQKFTDRGGRVSVTVARDGEDQAAVAVRDTGIGIAPEMLGRLFEPFAQGEHDNERRRGGLGLGLALVKGLVELHGGRVEVNSDGPGFGTEFRFLLPLANPDTDAPASEV
jgi:signal transduction histidine kinase